MRLMLGTELPVPTDSREGGPAAMHIHLKASGSRSVHQDAILDFLVDAKCLGGF